MSQSGEMNAVFHRRKRGGKRLWKLYIKRRFKEITRAATPAAVTWKSKIVVSTVTKKEKPRNSSWN